MALLATAAVFTVARPRYQPEVTIENVDLAKVRHHSPVEVREAFAAEGIRFTAAVRDSGTTWLGVGPRPWDDRDLFVMVLPESGIFGLGHGDWEEDAFDERVGNVLVHYGGDDEAVLKQVQAAVASLRPFAARPGTQY